MVFLSCKMAQHILNFKEVGWETELNTSVSETYGNSRFSYFAVTKENMFLSNSFEICFWAKQNFSITCFHFEIIKPKNQHTFL